jgi:syntaxin 5
LENEKFPSLILYYLHTTQKEYISDIYIGMRSNITLKDRTNEFNSIAESMVHKFKVNKKQEKSSRSDIVNKSITVNKKASEIGKKLTTTAEKLKELTELAKTQYLFGDPAQKIEHLTKVVSFEINNVKIDIEELERFIGTSSGNKQTSDHSSTLIRTLNSNLLSTTEEFNNALQLRTQNLRAQQERINKITYGGRSGKSLIYRPLSCVDDEDSKTGDDIRIAIPQFQTEVEDDLQLGSKANAVRDIARYMSEIQDIFKKLSTLVVREREQLERLEDITEMTTIQAESALEELLKYLKGLGSDRWLIIKSFLLIFFFLFLWFMFFI